MIRLALLEARSGGCVENGWMRGECESRKMELVQGSWQDTVIALN